MIKLFFSVMPPLMLLGFCWAFSAFSPIGWPMAIVVALLMIACQVIINKKAPQEFYRNIIYQTWLVVFALGRCLGIAEGNLIRVFFWIAIVLYMLWLCIKLMNNRQQ